MNSLPDSSLCSVLDSLTTDEVDALRACVPWTPYPGPQSDAYLSEADELYYGGAAGGGKSFLGIGLSITCHRNTLFLRRQQVDAKPLAEAYKGLPGSWKSLGYGGEFRTGDGRLVEVGGCQHEDDWKKYAGHAHDLKLFDELPQFSQKQFATISAWNRVRDPLRFPDQRCRVIGLGNPPTDPQGEWVLRYWAPWLDPSAGKVAAPGELRWYVRVDGEDDPRPVEDGTPVDFKGKTYQPKSRTFIPARVEDNPAYMAQGYDATLNALPEPLRSQLRYGNMMAGRQDDAWQLVPTKWVVEAQRRWADRKPAGFGPVTAVGCDPARGGADRTAVAPRHGLTVSAVVLKKGKDTPDGQSVVNMLLPFGAVPVNVDGIGVGASACDVAKMMGMANVRPVIVSNAANWRDPRHPQFKFANLRSAMMWKVRSLLDPEGGPPETRLALPPEPELLADLTAPRYALRVSGVQVESKDDIRERIGRSTDMGDAVALSVWEVSTGGWAVSGR